MRCHMHGYKIGIGLLGDKCCEHTASDLISRISTFYNNYNGTPNKPDQWLLIGLSLGRAGDMIIQLLKKRPNRAFISAKPCTNRIEFPHISLYSA